MENIETLLAAVAQTQGYDDDEPVVAAEPELGLRNSESSPVIRIDVGGSQLNGDARPSAMVDTPPPAVTPAFPAVGRVIGAVEKRKRGRPPKGQVVVKLPPPKRTKVEDEDEDVCFICFDGGSLVLCDRKGCPKAYHPACIKRDEAFFQSKAKWNCGWHICSVCRKSSHYMCYTCTYSLCKGCTKDADYFCVRGNNGFCSTCMKTIMLIEKVDQANNESLQVDFDDKTSWEYLFKVYWVCLKEKLSLTLSELTHAKKPWKGVAAVACKPQLSNGLHSAVGGEVSISYRTTEHLELNKPHVEISLLQNDVLRTTRSSIGNHVEEPNNEKGGVGPSHNKDTTKPSRDEVVAEVSIDKATEEPGIKAASNELGIEKDRDDPGIKVASEELGIEKDRDDPGIKAASEELGIGKDRDVPSLVEDTCKPCICKNTVDIESAKPGIDSGTEWASKDLLEFVAHMKNGDTSAISQFDVQKLLLDYIKRNNLRDPRRKSQIICDLRLTNLFGKPRVGHIEMLKLLEFHFLIKEDSQKNSFIPAGFVSSVASDMEVDGNIYGSPIRINSRKRKTRKKGEERALPNNLDEYAAIDVHNINLIYLRRNLMEHLIDDHGNFINKVIGSIVRIRISSNDQKQDVYRLVQVVGTTKVAEPYKIGDRKADVMLEVLNLDKKEVVSIDAISNQEFTEDECRRLRQSIRCGLVKQFNVGEVQKKAMALQTVRVNDWLEAEILRLNHLRDRASENGRKKELREYVEKLQLLKSPEERQRRISEVPQIHADPKMSPNYESEEDTRIADNINKDEYVRPSYSGFSRSRRKPISPNKKGKEERYIQAQNRLMEKTDATISHVLDKHMNQVNITNSATCGRNDEAMQRSGLETSIATSSVGTSPSANHIETEKLWHYRDPNGKIQGPFSMMQLRKWSTTGLFPPDMRIWTNHEQYDSLLLTDALNGKFHGASEWLNKPSPGLHRNEAIGGIGISEAVQVTGRDSKQTEEARSSSVHVSSDSNSRLLTADESGSSSWPRCRDSLEDNKASSDDVQARNLLPSSSPGKTHVALPDCGQESDESNHGSQNVEKNSTVLTQNQMNCGHGLQDQSNNQDQAISCKENLRSLNIDLISIHMESGSAIAPLSRSPDSSEQVGDVNVLYLPSPTPNTVENQQSVCSDFPLQNSRILELLSPTPKSNDEDRGVHGADKQSGFAKSPVPNSGPGWGGASGLGIGGLQLPEVADEWCGYSPTPGKTSVHEWDSCLVAASSSRPAEVTSENIATSTSDSHQIMHISPPLPAPNMPNWLSIINEPIEFDALGEESVSDLLAEVDAMEQGTLHSPTSAIKFARELIEDCKDDCFSSIEDFSPTPDPRKSDAVSSTGEVQLTSQSSVPYKPIETSPIDAFDFFRRSSVHSSGSSEGETNAPVCSGDAGSEFHPIIQNNTNQDMIAGAKTTSGMGSETTDPGWGTVQGNINLVTVQGNVNLVLGGPSQGMANLSWGTNPATAWANPNMNRSPNGSLPWDGQRKYGGERFSSPREWGYQGSDSGFGRGRAPWGRQQPYGGGGYPRPHAKGQRVCKFYESGHCKKGAFCDYLHP